MAARIGVIIGYQNGSGGIEVLVKSWDDTTPYTDRGTDAIAFSTTGLTTAEQMINAAVSAINAFAVTNSFTWTVLIKELDGAAPKLVAAPQAAIANAPADAVTDYNVLTTLLGTLTGAVNTANTKQNDIATKLNTLLAELRTLGLIAT